jgi:ribonuclease P/MRP protein subunit RPP40
VINGLDRLKKFKSPGPDKLLPFILKNVKESITDNLVKIFNHSLDTSTIPLDWKLANVTPIHKKGDKSIAGNYRPISLTSVIGKLLEQVITASVTKHLEVNNLIGDSQHGFRRKRSCLTNLLEFFHDMYIDYDKYKVADIIYLDFQKAFDKVPHRRLLTKIRALGIGGKVADWIEQWLTGRKQRVVINGIASEWVNVTSGVPQGSVLGPLLFVIYINDLDRGLVSKLGKFADDTKLGNRVDSQNYIDNIQADIDRLVGWVENWQMSFNISKCKVMHIGSSNPKPVYTMHGLPLEVTEVEKDLGVLISSDLKSTKQCIEVEKKCNRLLGYIRRQFQFRNKKIVKTLYNSLILPHLQYCIQFWCPSLNKDIDRLERIQARATKLIPEIRHMTYEDRLEALNMPTLKDRRIRLDLIQTYKILNGFDNVDYRKYFTLNENSTRNNGYKLAVKSHNTSVLGNFFTYRVVKYWNSLPPEVVSSETISTFKNRLDKVFKSTFHSNWP